MYLWWLRRHIHQSWLIAVAALGVTIGVIACQWVTVSNNSAFLLVGLVGVVGCLWRRKLYVLPLVLLCGALIGIWRGEGDIVGRRQYVSLYNTPQVVEGMVADDPSEDAHGSSTLKLNDIVCKNQKLPGTVWVNVATKAALKRYDRVKLTGTLKPGFGSFAASLKSAKLVSVQKANDDSAGAMRDEFSKRIRRALPEPEASLGIGYLVGQKSALPPELDEAFRTVGLTHIVVASGYNLTILVRLARRLFMRISKYTAAFASFAMIGGFMAVTGMNPSMARAGLVSCLSILAWYYGRKFHPLVLLPIAAATTLLITPSYGWNDLGWELSFLSFAGVMVVAPLLQCYFFGDTSPSILRQIFGETVCAQLMATPVIVLAFGQFSVVAVFANLLILPLVPLAMLLTFVAGVASLEVVGLPAYMVLKYMTETSQYMASFSWAQLQVSINAIGIAIYYILLLGCCLWMWYKTRLNLRNTSIVE